MPARLLLIRHGEIDTLRPGCFIGKSDVSLSLRGRTQASRLSQVMAKEKPAICFCSPLKRTMDTASLAMGDHGFRAECDANLREIDFGHWENKTFEEIEKADPEAIRDWAAYAIAFRFPFGESIGEFLDRIRAAAERLIEAARGRAESIAVFTHGGVIRALICHFLGLDPRHYLLFDVRPASVTTIQLFEDKGILTGLNDVCHLGEDT